MTISRSNPMTATTERLPLYVAEQTAAEVVALLSPFCERIQIAGSIRRRKATVKDIEVVALPKVVTRTADLFGDVQVSRDLLHEHVVSLRDTDVLNERLDINGRPRFGVKTKLLRFQGVSVDLFTADRDNWGWIVMLRTGPGEFNTRVVTQRIAGGTIMPHGMRSEGGYLWRWSEKLSTPEESDAFEAIGLDWIDPEARR